MRPALFARALFARVVVVASFKAPLLHSVPPRSSAPPLVRMASDKSFRNPHNLPTKVCVVCNRPFTWRKKWENCWDEVKCCSKRCQSERKSNRKKGADEGVEGAAAIRADEVPTVPRGRRRKQQARMSAADDDPEDAPDEPEDAPDEPVGGGGGGRSESSEAEEEGLSVEGPGVEEEDARAARKAARKAGKLARRAVREGRAAPGVGRKACDLCGRPVDLLVRCQVDASKRWQMACGKCWATDAVSGGVVDGSGANPHYRYGGLWKNLKKGSSSPPPPAAAATRAGTREQVGGQSSDHDDDEGVEGVRSLLSELGVSAGDRSS